MSKNLTGIGWTEKTWNVLAGCSKVSDGCKNCYAINDANRMANSDQPKIKAKYLPVVTNRTGKPNWTGEITFTEHTLFKPLQVQKPVVWFVNSMSDIFHHNVPDHWIDQLFAVMALAGQHTFQTLTKRAERQAEYWQSAATLFRIGAQIMFLKTTEHGLTKNIDVSNLVGTDRNGAPYLKLTALRNIWTGVSAENQPAANERVPLLINTPAAVRWLSCEPLLGQVILKNGWLRHIDWLVAGGESGAGARAMHPLWLASLQDQCENAGVPFFFKQWGNWSPVQPPNKTAIDVFLPNGERYNSTKPDQWHLPEMATMYKYADKHKAGNALDGVIYEQMPVCFDASHFRK